MSISTNGPSGETFDPATASSIFLTESPCSSCARQISPAAEFRMRLTTKPGTSAQVIGCFPIACAKLKAAVTVSREVSAPAMTSTSGITDAG